MWLANDNPGPSLRPRSAADAAMLFGAGFATCPIETFKAAHLDGEGRVIAITEQAGLHDTVLISTADLLREACIHRTRRLILAHNHPSGDPSPSATDRLTTRRIAELLRLLDIEFVDHLIFARGGVVRFRAIGLL